MTIFEKYLTLWVTLCIAAGILLGRTAPSVATALDSLSVYQVSIPIAVCLFFMMYPIMVKIDFKDVVRAGKTPKPVLMTLGINWLIKPFTMYLIASLFLGVLFRRFLPGTEIIKTGQEVELWRSYISGTILLGIAPCTAMVLLFSLKGDVILGNPLTILWIAVPLFIQTILIFTLGYFLMSRLLKLSYHDAAPASMIGASNHFEVAIATPTMLYGLSSGASLATVVGVLIGVPVMLLLVSICKRTCHLFRECNLDLPQCSRAKKKLLQSEV